MQYLSEVPPAYLSILAKGVASVIALALMPALNRVVGRFLQRRFHDLSRTHTLRMVLRNAILLVGSALIVFIWIGFGNFAVFMGILGAGIAFASQEVIGSIAGYLNIVTGNLYHIGDRVRIGDVVGDVMDITLLRTTLMQSCRMRASVTPAALAASFAVSHSSEFPAISSLVSTLPRPWMKGILRLILLFLFTYSRFDSCFSTFISVLQTRKRLQMS